MKDVPDIFKPGINKKLNNNDKVFYSAVKEDRSVKSFDSKIKPKRNIKQEILLKKSFGKNYLIKTATREYYDKIIDRMGNNIILSNGKVISVSNIIAIYED